jgi:NAD(P)-dependent dehydrogenase (short-subunit alcohol dehydrogenase family)
MKRMVTLVVGADGLIGSHLTERMLMRRYNARALCYLYRMVGNDSRLYEETSLNPSATYPAIKCGLINVFRFLATRWRGRQIRVDCVSPGGIKSSQDSNFILRYEQRGPLMRMGKPEDIAPPVTFLLSDGAFYITGQNIVVDGGWTSV